MRSPRRLEPCVAPAVRQTMTTASPDSAMTHPATHVFETRRRSMRVPKRLVNTGNVASTSAPCIAEVVDCPMVNISGNAMNAANPENARSCRPRVSVGSGWRVASASGSARQPANTVRRMPTSSGSIWPAATLVNSGVPPQTTMSASATATGTQGSSANLRDSGRL